ncbi:MAG: amidohydrolase family protein [Candidatus Krumholzibacteriia bacterium]
MKRVALQMSMAALVVVLAAGSAGAEKVALVGGTVHPVNAPSIARATLLIDGEEIVAVGTDVRIPPDARVMNVQGLHVYPALVNANSVLGLVEVSSVPGTVDISEMGDINPNVRAEVAINPDSEILPVTMANGILVAMIAARGGLISGTAAVIRLDGWTWEDMTIESPVGLVVNWPGMRVQTGSGAPAREKQIEKRDEKLRLLREAFADARAYMKARDAEGEKGVPVHDRDPRWEAMLPVLRGEIPVMVAASDILQIRSALRWAEEEDLDLVLISGGDVWRVADELAARDVAVILTPVHTLPRRRWEPYDTPFTIAHKLHQAGVRFCFAHSARSFGAAHSRNLPYMAATAAAYGLPKQEALRGVTQYAAEILGVGDRLGTLEPGKEATLIVTDGDPLEIRTHVLDAFMAGRRLDLDNRHTRLYEKYRARPRPQPRRGEPAITTR